jgi:hypothetical protein
LLSLEVVAAVVEVVVTAVEVVLVDTVSLHLSI